MWVVSLLLMLSCCVGPMLGGCEERGQEVHCSCDRKVAEEASGLFVTFNAFEHTSRVTVTDCHNVTFIGNAYLPHPPSVIRFVNVGDVYHQLEGQRWSQAEVKGHVVASIRSIEFVNVTRIFQLHLNELFPVNQVDLLLFRNVSEVRNMECLPEVGGGPPDILPSRIAEVVIESTYIRDLKPYSFNLVANRKFVIRGARIFYWWSRAIDVGRDNRKFSLLSTKVTHLHSDPVTGSVAEEAEVRDSSIGTVEDRAFSAFRFTRHLRMTGNDVRNATSGAFEGLFRWTRNRTVVFSANSLPCPAHNVHNRMCLLNVSEHARADNNTCYSMDRAQRSAKHFDLYYDIRCPLAASTSGPLVPSPRSYVIAASLIVALVLRKKS